MYNPSGPYPGRQLLVGITPGGRPCFVYLVTGRSPASRERIATLAENTVRIGPLNVVQYDPLRHYSAVKYDDRSGVLAVSNGIQTEAVFEAYKLIRNTCDQPDGSYLGKILEGAGAEPDPPLNTARIAGVVTARGEEVALFVSIKAHGRPAETWQPNGTPGSLFGVSTYQGDIEKPVAPETSRLPFKLEFKGEKAAELAAFLFDLSAATYKGSDIRVCTVAGIRADRKWEIALKNVMLA